MKQIIIRKKRYAISPHKNNTHYDLMEWVSYGEDSKKYKQGVKGRWKFYKCVNNFEQLAKLLLNMQINDETAHDVQSMLTAWAEAVAMIVEALERNVEK